MLGPVIKAAQFLFKGPQVLAGRLLDSGDHILASPLLLPTALAADGIRDSLRLTP